MKRTLFVVSALAAAAAPPVAAQQSIACARVPSQAQDACQKTSDLYGFLVPQLGTLIAGGSATMGVGGTLGGFGHLSLGIRANTADGRLPQVSTTEVHTDGMHSDEIATRAQVVAFPTADVAVGLFGGIPLGLTRIGGLDAIASVAYVPSITSGANDLSVRTPDGSLKIGYGGRLSVLGESMLVPGVSVSYLVRDLPTLDVSGTTTNGDTVDARGVAARTRAWRVTASKTLSVLGLAAGAGRDTYVSDGTLHVYVSPRTTATCVAGLCRADATFTQSLERTNYFADVSLNFPALKLVGEIGRASGGAVSTYNSFAGRRAGDPLTYASAGVRVAF